MAKSEIQNGFIGPFFTLTDNWLSKIPLPDGPIKYLEIGAFYGGNICSVVKTYAKADGSEVHCVDPWISYEKYPEYHGEGRFNDMYSSFLKNIGNLPKSDSSKINVHRGFSGDILPTFKNEYFDIIYIDGNHEAPYVLEDAILSYKKLKPGGWLIFDDWTWDGVQAGLNAFMHVFGTHFEAPELLPGIQCIMKKKIDIPVPTPFNH